MIDEQLQLAGGVGLHLIHVDDGAIGDAAGLTEMNAALALHLIRSFAASAGPCHARQQQSGPGQCENRI